VNYLTVSSGYNVVSSDFDRNAQCDKPEESSVIAAVGLPRNMTIPAWFGFDWAYNYYQCVIVPVL
jgi:hypothetical protein